MKPWNRGPPAMWKEGIAVHDWQKLRAKKYSYPKNFMNIVADAVKNEDYMSPEERRSLYKEKGIAPPRLWQERSIYIACSTQILDAFIPPEGDGKASLISKEVSCRAKIFQCVTVFSRLILACHPRVQKSGLQS